MKNTDKKSKKSNANIVRYLIATVIFMSDIALTLYRGCNTGNILWSIAMFFIMHEVQLIIHEVGHLTFGRITGYRLLYLNISCVYVIGNEKGKPKIRFKKSRGGQCVMYPGTKCRERYFLYNAGGNIANIFLTLASIALLIPGYYVLTIAAIQLIFTGVNKVISNSIPFASDLTNDSSIIKLLHNNESTRKDYFDYLTVYSCYFRDIPIDREKYDLTRKCDKSDETLVYYNEIVEILEIENNTKCK